ncbi:MAG: O-antigen ligase family protein [Chloroflexi bacterium]|nr:O-antigen ligase family protein [Chloroflexota bacterium]
MNTPYPAKIWLAALMALPLFFNPLSRWQYEPDKVALLLALTGLLLGVTFGRGNIPQPSKNRAERWLVVFLLVDLLALFGSEMPHWGLWGDPAWRNGLLLTLACAIVFGLAHRQLFSLERQRPLFQAVVWTSMVVAIYGILEQLRLNPLVNDEDTVRASATLAHANLLAIYLAMTMPLTLTLILNHWLRREVGAAILILQGICLVFTYSRAGWLAALAGMSIWAGFWLWNRGGKKLARLVLISTLAGLVGLFILSMLPPLPGSSPHALQTLTNMFRWKGATAQIRFLGWEAAADAFQERPILGYGPASYGRVLEWHLPPELAPFGGAEAMGGRIHNRLMEVLIETGGLGLVVYIGLLIAVFTPIIRQVLSSSDNTIKIGILAAMSANLVGTQFSFESSVTLFLFWVLAGMAHAEPPPLTEIGSIRKQPILGIVVTGLGLLVMGLITGPDMLVYRGESQCGKSTDCDPIQTIQWAVDFSPTSEIFEMALANALAASGHDWQAGGIVLQKLVEKHPTIVEFHQAYALYLRRWSASTQNNEIAADSIDQYTRAIRLSPHDPDLWIDRGLVWLQMDEPNFALADFQQSNRLLDDYTRYYGAMSVYASMQGDVTAAQSWQDLATAAQRKWDNWVWRR